MAAKASNCKLEKKTKKQEDKEIFLRGEKDEMIYREHLAFFCNSENISFKFPIHFPSII